MANDIKAVLADVLTDYGKELSPKDEANVQAIIAMTAGTSPMVQARALAMRKAFNRDFTTQAGDLFKN